MTVATLIPDLPIELLSDIVESAIHDNPKPVSILQVNSTFYTLAIPALYRHLHFRNARQLELFSQVPSVLPLFPRHIELSLPGGAVEFQLFRTLGSAFKRWSIGKAQGGPVTYENGDNSIRSHVDHVKYICICLHTLTKECCKCLIPLAFIVAIAHNASSKNCLRDLLPDSLWVVYTTEVRTN